MITVRTPQIDKGAADVQLTKGLGDWLPLRSCDALSPLGQSCNMHDLISIQIRRTSQRPAIGQLAEGL